jgi:hypothetical protein
MLNMELLCGGGCGAAKEFATTLKDKAGMNCKEESGTVDAEGYCEAKLECAYTSPGNRQTIGDAASLVGCDITRAEIDGQETFI